MSESLFWDISRDTLNFDTSTLKTSVNEITVKKSTRLSSALFYTERRTNFFLRGNKNGYF